MCDVCQGVAPTSECGGEGKMHSQASDIDLRFAVVVPVVVVWIVAVVVVVVVVVVGRLSCFTDDL